MKIWDFNLFLECTYFFERYLWKKKKLLTF